MEEIVPTINLVMYFMLDSIKQKSIHHFFGAHGYTYDVTETGKKKLVKDVPTSSGYFTNNVQKANTVVVVKDIVSLEITNRRTKTESLLQGFLTTLDLFKTNPAMKNLCVITVQKELGTITRLKETDLKHKEDLKFAGEVVSKKERELLTDIFHTLEWFKDTGRSVVFDFTGMAEGGAGVRECQKRLDLAQVITVWDFESSNELVIVSRKEYEDPEVHFNKLVDATRWYCSSGEGSTFYDLHEGYRVYDFGKVEPDKNYYGKLTPDVTFAKLFTLKPLELLDKLYDFCNKRIENKDGYLLAGDLNNIVSKDVARLIDQVPGVPNKKGKVFSPFTKQKSKPLLMELISPVLMSYRVKDYLGALNIIFEAFMKKDAEGKSGYSTFYNITDLIYVKEVNGKGVTKLKLNPNFTQGSATFVVKVHHPSSKKPVPITLSIGYDLPDRNSFNSVEDPDVEVWCVTDTRNDKGLRYATVVKTGEFIYVHTSAVANLRVLTLNELGKDA